MVASATVITLERPLTHHRVWYGPSKHVRVTVAKDGLLGDGRIEPYPWKMPPFPRCISKRVGHALWGADANVIACSGDGDASDEWREPRGVAVCVPPIYTLPPPAGNEAKTGAQVTEFMKHHRAMGIEHFFIYVCHEHFIRNQSSLQASDTTVLHTPFCTTVNMTMRAQNWMINECIQRAAAAHYEWVLSCDVDERLGLRDGLSLPMLLDDHRDFDVITLGSVLRWRHPNGSVAGEAKHCQVRNHDRNMCIGFEGHRKHLTRAHRMYVANLHFVARGTWVRQCRSNGTDGTVAVACNMVDLSASEAWLYHESASAQYSRTAWMGHLNIYRNGTRNQHDVPPPVLQQQR